MLLLLFGGGGLLFDKYGVSFAHSLLLQQVGEVGQEVGEDGMGVPFSWIFLTRSTLNCIIILKLNCTVLIFRPRSTNSPDNKQSSCFLIPIPKLCSPEGRIKEIQAYGLDLVIARNLSYHLPERSVNKLTISNY